MPKIFPPDAAEEEIQEWLDAEHARRPADERARIESNVRISDLASSIARAVNAARKQDPELTADEITAALVTAAGRWVDHRRACPPAGPTA